jgi:hypothetical protein
VEAVEEVLLGPALGGLEFIWDFEQEVEVVAQAAPGQAAQAAEAQLSEQECAEELAFGGAEDDVAAGEAGDDVVAMGLAFGPQQMAAQFPHGPTLARYRQMSMKKVTATLLDFTL